MDSNGLYQQFQQAFQNANQYTPTNIGDLTKMVNAKVNNFAPQWQDLGNMKAGVFAAPATQMADFYKTYGTGANSGIDPMTALANITQRIGGMQGNVDAYGNTLNTAGGNLKDIANSALQGWNTAADRAMQNANLLSSQYENQANRENAIKQAQIANSAAMARLQWEKDQATLNTPYIGNDGQVHYKNPALEQQNQNNITTQATQKANLDQFSKLAGLNGGNINYTDSNVQQMQKLGAQYVGDSNGNPIYQLGSYRITLQKPADIAPQDSHPLQGIHDWYQNAISPNAGLTNLLIPGASLYGATGLKLPWQ